jgi:hypothetical protein
MRKSVEPLKFWPVPSHGRTYDIVPAMVETPNLGHLEMAILERFGVKSSQVYLYEGN